MLQMLYSIRSERQLVERLEYDLLFRWFVGLGVDDAVFDASTISKNRDRLLTTEVAQGFLSALLALPQVARLLSTEHLSVDGTLLRAWASMKSFRENDGSDEPPGPGRETRAFDHKGRYVAHAGGAQSCGGLGGSGRFGIAEPCLRLRILSEYRLSFC